MKIKNRKPILSGDKNPTPKTEELDFHSPDPEHDLKPVGLLSAAVVVSLCSAVLGLVLLGWLAEEVLSGPARGMDLTFRNWLHQHVTAGRTRAASAAYQPVPRTSEAASRLGIRSAGGVPGTATSEPSARCTRASGACAPDMNSRCSHDD